MIPQLIIISLALIGIGYKVAKHGEPIQDPKPHNAWISIISAMILHYILYCGGFYDKLL